MAVDFLGKPFVVGDQVVFAQLHYRHFLIGTITKITDKTATVESVQDGYTRATKQFHDQLIKIEKI